LWFENKNRMRRVKILEKQLYKKGEAPEEEAIPWAG
jgi:hypothetical protein